MYLLEPHHYSAPEHYQSEIDRVFLPGWHFLGTTRDLPMPGDYMTLELFGRPLLVRNMDGEICAFENICCHRHCEIASEAKGHSAVLKCQYHGWEFQKDGRTGRIPHAKYFRPWDRESSRLRTFRTATCGELVFVSLTSEGPTLAEHLGDYYQVLSESFSPPWFVPVWQWEIDIHADWKIPIENTLEGYHIECLHKKSLKAMTPEEYNFHSFGDGWSTQLARNAHHGFIEIMTDWMVRRLGRTPTPDYVHHIIYPNFVYIGMDTFRLAEAFIPTGLGTTRQMVYLYALQGPRKSPLALGVKPILKMAVRAAVKQILGEDVPIFERQQRGVARSTHPGVLGALEERVYHFQKYIVRACYGDTEVETQELPTPLWTPRQL